MDEKHSRVFDQQLGGLWPFSSSQLTFSESTIMSNKIKLNCIILQQGLQETSSITIENEKYFSDVSIHFFTNLLKASRIKFYIVNNLPSDQNFREVIKTLNDVSALDSIGEHFCNTRINTGDQRIIVKEKLIQLILLSTSRPQEKENRLLRMHRGEIEEGDGYFMNLDESTMSTLAKPSGSTSATIIWYHVLYNGRYLKKLRGFSGRDFSDLRFAIWNQEGKHNLANSPSMLKLSFIDANGQESVLDDKFEENTDFPTFMLNNKITEKNPILVELPNEASQAHVVVPQESLESLDVPQEPTEISRAFNIQYQDHDFIGDLNNSIDIVTESTHTHHNFLSIVQSSGYGKTRAALQIAKIRPLVYVCFRHPSSTGYPPATPRSSEILGILRSGLNVSKTIALRWMKCVIETYEESFGNNFIEYNNKLLKDEEESRCFWDKVFQRYRNNSRTIQLSRNKKKIVIFFDEASALLSEDDNSESNNGKNIPYKAIRNALNELKAYVVGVFIDTCSSVTGLLPSKKDDPSRRQHSLVNHVPFVQIATIDCLSEIDNVPKENVTKNGYDIVRFGRPLWASLWVGKDSDEEMKFKEIVQLAKSKLLGGVVNLDQPAGEPSLALIGSTACLFVSSISSEAQDLVKSNMATLVAIGNDNRSHIVTYPSEPVLSEAALELLQDDKFMDKVLTNVEASFKRGGILNAGTQGELAARILLLDGWRRLIMKERENNKSDVSFSVRRNVLSYLKELFNDDFDLIEDNFSHLENAEMGFTHFITLIGYMPTSKAELKSFYDRRAALILQKDQVGGDLGIVIKVAKDGKDIYLLLIIQVKNQKDPRRNEENENSGENISPVYVLSSECKFEDYLSIYLNLGSQYVALNSKRYDITSDTTTSLINTSNISTTNTSERKTAILTDVRNWNADSNVTSDITPSPINVSNISLSPAEHNWNTDSDVTSDTDTTTSTINASNISTTEESDPAILTNEHNRIMAFGLEIFRIKDRRRNIISNLLRTQYDPVSFYSGDRRKYLFDIMPLSYSSSRSIDNTASQKTNTCGNYGRQGNNSRGCRFPKITNKTGKTSNSRKRKANTSLVPRQPNKKYKGRGMTMP